MKRSGEACTALAESILGAGGGADVREAMRLLKEGCLYRDRTACMHAGRMYLSGDRVAKDADQARSLLDRACELGAKEGCALK
jgi:TPR repeat protein